MKVLRSPFLWFFIFFILAMITLPGLFNSVIYKLGFDDTYSTYEKFIEAEKSLRYLGNVLTQLVLIAFFVFLNSKSKHFTSNRKISVKGVDFLYGIVGFFLKIILSVFGVGLLVLSGFDIETTLPENQKRVEEFISVSSIAVISVVIFAPILEEVVFRKLLIGHMFENHKYWGLAISSALFGGVHLISGFSILGLIMYSTMGLILGYFYIRTNRIETSIIVHSINNLISFIMVAYL